MGRRWTRTPSPIRRWPPRSGRTTSRAKGRMSSTSSCGEAIGPPHGSPGSSRIPPSRGTFDLSELLDLKLIDGVDLEAQEASPEHDLVVVDAGGVVNHKPPHLEIPVWASIHPEARKLLESAAPSKSPSEALGLSPGDVVRTGYGTGPYRVESVSGPYRTAHCSTHGRDCPIDGEPVYSLVGYDAEPTPGRLNTPSYLNELRNEAAGSSPSRAGATRANPIFDPVNCAIPVAKRYVEVVSGRASRPPAPFPVRSPGHPARRIHPGELRAASLRVESRVKVDQIYCAVHGKRCKSGRDVWNWSPPRSGRRRRPSRQEGRPTPVRGLLSGRLRDGETPPVPVRDEPLGRVRCGDARGRRGADPRPRGDGDPGPGPDQGWNADARVRRHLLPEGGDGEAPRPGRGPDAPGARQVIAEILEPPAAAPSSAPARPSGRTTPRSRSSAG